MIHGSRVLCLVPARGGSKGLPRKNVLPIAGAPLVAWPVTAGLNSKYIDLVVCSTDDLEIAEAAEVAGADIPFIRPSELASDDASSIDVVEHALSFLESKGKAFDYIVLLEPTSPLTESHDIDAALEQLVHRSADAEAIVGISRVEHTHPDYNITFDSANFIAPTSVKNFDDLTRRQELKDVYHLDGSLYISTVSGIRKNKSFYHSKTLGYSMPRWKSFEIDEYIDFVCVEAVLQKRELLRNRS